MAAAGAREGNGPPLPSAQPRKEPQNSLIFRRHFFSDVAESPAAGRDAEGVARAPIGAVTSDPLGTLTLDSDKS